MSDFIQIEPQAGSPATQQTEVWLLFDDEFVYVSARCWESNPERMVANEMRRDNSNITQNELFAFSLDTFYDRRNGVLFNTNPIGGRMDGQITNETQFNGDWNPIWRVVSGRFEGGWTVEAAIPFRSLRYRPGREQVWGFNVLRNNRWKNEITFLTPIPAVKGAGLGIMMMSAAATVYGLEAPAGSRNLELKPFAITNLTSDHTAVPRVSNDLSGDLGLDVKYGITQSLVADLTVNTDFAQVEADEQQVNLTRFSLFFPEKRESFYDNVRVNTYWAKTRTRGFEDDVSYRTQFDYAADRYGLQVERLVVGTDFNPEMGFLRRDDFERSFGSVRFSPRPRSITAIRKVSYSAQFDYITDRAGVLETREAQGRLGIEFETSDNVDVTYTRSYELLTEPFPIAPDVTIPIGGYSFQDVRASFRFGPQRRVSGGLSARHGGFLSGDRTSVGFTGGRVEVTPQLSVEPGVSVNWIDLPEGRFTTRLVTVRTTYTVTPLMFVSALVQVNSSTDSLGANIRLRWEYQPGSELFVVYNEQRNPLDQGFPALANRAFIVKINRLFTF